MAARYVGGTMSNPPAFETWLEHCAGLVRWQASVNSNKYWWRKRKAWTKRGKARASVVAEFLGDGFVEIRVKEGTACYDGPEVSALRTAGTAGDAAS
jgi:hypothetical protein